MKRIYACIDGRDHTHAVIDWAAWAALRMALPLEFLHVLERHPERSTDADYSGAIGPDAQDNLLRTLSAEDAQRSKAAREAGRLMLAAARARAANSGTAGTIELDGRLRHGELVATLMELAADTALIVLGEHHQAPAEVRAPAGHHLERVVRGVQRPILVASTQAFAAPQRIVLAFDGSAPARLAARQLARHPLTADLPVLVAIVGTPTPKVQSLMKQTQSTLTEAGSTVETVCLPGEAQTALPDLVKSQGPALLVMGAYGHSRLRQMLLGSTTTTLLRMGDVPVLILR